MLRIDIDPLNQCQSKNELCHQLHKEVLKKFGLHKLIAAKEANTLTPKHGYLITVVDSLHENIVASSRVYIADESTYLPIEKILQQQTGKSPYWRSNFTPNTYGETSGCWVNHEYTGLSIPNMLLRVSIIAALQSKLQYLMIFHNKITQKNVEHFGFQIVKNFGNQGELYYPDKRYISTVRNLQIPNLPTVPHQERTMIQTLCKEQRHISKSNNIEIDYNLQALFNQNRLTDAS